MYRVPFSSNGVGSGHRVGDACARDSSMPFCSLIVCERYVQVRSFRRVCSVSECETGCFGSSARLGNITRDTVGQIHPGCISLSGRIVYMFSASVWFTFVVDHSFPLHSHCSPLYFIVQCYLSSVIFLLCFPVLSRHTPLFIYFVVL